MKILLIGGRGFLGTHLLNALHQAGPELFTVSIGSRSGRDGDLTIDLAELTHFSKLHGYDAVVNCAAIPPDRYEPLIRYCLTTGVRLLDTTADPPTIGVLTELTETLQKVAQPTKGLFIYGVGVFPGLSNLLIRQELSAAKNAHSATLAINYKVSSGAGKGMCRLMIETISSPCRWYEKGQVMTSQAPFHSLQRLPFGNRLRPAMQVNLGELHTLHALLPQGSVNCFISFRPSFFNRPSYYFFNAVAITRIGRKTILPLLYNVFYLLRAKILRKAKTDIRLLCSVVSNHDTTTRELWLSDALLAAGLFTAAILRLLADAPEIMGCYSSEDLWDLQTILPLMARLGKNTFHYSSAYFPTRISVV